MFSPVSGAGQSMGPFRPSKTDTLTEVKSRIQLGANEQIQSMEIPNPKGGPPLQITMSDYGYVETKSDLATNIMTLAGQDGRMELGELKEVVGRLVQHESRLEEMLFARSKPVSAARVGVYFDEVEFNQTKKEVETLKAQVASDFGEVPKIDIYSDPGKLAGILSEIDLTPELGEDVAAIQAPVSGSASEVSENIISTIKTKGAIERTAEFMAEYGISADEMRGIQGYISSDYVAINGTLRSAGNEGGLTFEELRDQVDKWAKAESDYDVMMFAKQSPKIAAESGIVFNRDVMLGAKAEMDAAREVIGAQFGKLGGTAEGAQSIISKTDLAVGALSKMPSYHNPDSETGITMVSRVTGSGFTLPSGETYLESLQAAAASGEPITEKAFFSTSGNLGGIDTVGDKDTIMFIECPEGHKGKEITQFSGWGDFEKEVLFPPGSQFQVGHVAKNEETGKIEVYMRAVV